MKFAWYSSVEQLPADTDAIFHAGAQHSMFCSREWYAALEQHVPPDVGELVYTGVESGHRLLGLLPLYRLSSTACVSARHRYSSFYTPLVTSDQNQGLWQCFADGLMAAGVNSLTLEPTEQSVPGLQPALLEQGFEAHVRFRFYNWIHPVRGATFEQYLGDRPARLKNTLARKHRKLHREQVAETRIYTGQDVPAAMADYYAPYQASWKAHEQYRSFLDQLVTNFSATGWSRLGVLYINEQPAAAQLWFVKYGKANIFRLAYNQAWKQYSPGSLLTASLMEYVLDIDKVHELDFLTGNEAYKQDWMSQRRERYAVSLVNAGKPADRSGTVVDRLRSLFR